jgi:Fe-S-cluster containining protein
MALRLRFDAEQHFSCAGCARCCRHTEVVITPAEREAYARANVGRWFREANDLPEGAAADPFVPLRGRRGWFRIRRRADGACGFLSAENRCRIHEELGGERKPLVCRMFPFAVHTTDVETVVTTSFSCPTVAANEGRLLGEQLVALKSLRLEWEREAAPPSRPLLFAAGRPMTSRALDAVRSSLLSLLDAPDAEGRVVLARNIRRLGLWIEDLSRARVVRLAPEDLAEYVILTGAFAVKTADRPVPDRRASRLARLLSRGRLFVTCAIEAQRIHREEGGLRLRLRAHLLRLLLHAHGVGPSTPELDMRAAHALPVDGNAVAPLARHYLRGAIETVGSGRHPVLDELARSAAVLHAAVALGAGVAVRAGRAHVDAAALREGLVRASGVTHVEGAAAAIVGALSAGPEAFFLLADRLSAS